MYTVRLLLFLCLGLSPLFCQSAELTPAPALALPTHIDGNSPAFWTEDGLNLFSSTGDPEMISVAPSLAGPWQSQRVDVTQHQHIPVWVEAAWRDADGTVFGWYHHEPGERCGPNKLTTPKIGAVISYDGGQSIKDLGIILESGDPSDCDAKNGFFAGGHGDFSVVLDADQQYFYFFFTNYGGEDKEQGIVTARMAFDDRFQPGGAVYKYYRGEFSQPGLGGHMTPIFRAQRSWREQNTDSYWGPAVHWNSHLKQFVMLMNRSCCEPGWPQEGIYVSFSTDLSDPTRWVRERRILEGSQLPVKPGYYPQVMGLGFGETDTLAGETARLFVHGVSHWMIAFSTENPPEQVLSGPEPVTPLPQP